jgi:hypothetical protein
MRFVHNAWTGDRWLRGAHMKIRTREVLHEQLHPLALVAKEVVDFG